jgi:Zn-finger nucleic acid-binding protein
MVSCRVCKTSFEAGSYRDELCPGCGALVPVSVRLCPCCTLPFERRDVEGLVFDECAQCGGVFLDHQTHKRLFADKTLALAEALVATVAHDEPARSNGRPALACPACADSMQRRLTDSGAGIVLDICLEHGTFFEMGKLPAIVAFVRKAAARSAAEGHAYAPVVTNTQYKHVGEKGGEAIFAGLIAVGFLVLRFMIAWAAHR